MLDCYPFAKHTSISKRNDPRQFAHSLRTYSLVTGLQGEVLAVTGLRLYDLGCWNDYSRSRVIIVQQPDLLLFLYLAEGNSVGKGRVTDATERLAAIGSHEHVAFHNARCKH
jgi:hypothetical protein